MKLHVRSKPTNMPRWTAYPCIPCSRLGISPRPQLLKKSTWLRHLIGDKAPPIPRDINWRGYPYTGNGELNLVFEQ